MIRKKKLLYALLALALFIPWGVIPVNAQLDATPDLSFDLWVLSWDDISVDTGTGIRTLLDEIGININVVIKDDDPMYEGLFQEPRLFTMYEMSHGYGSVPDHVWYRMHSENIIDWGDNPYGLNNATMDTALDNFITSTPATVHENARLVQLYATQNIPYIPLFLSDDTHAIRAEWTNYTIKPGGPFTSYNPQTMIFMYDTNLPSPMPFIMAYGSDIGELNPLVYRSERSHWYDMQVYDTLISYDESLDPIPWLCESYAISTDGTTVNFTIRTGAEWHDGQPLSADDVAFTFNYMKAAPELVGVVYWSFLQHMTSATAYGNVVSIVMDDAYTFALQNLGEIYIIPEHIWDGVAADDARWDDPANVTAHVGSGPFKFAARIADEYTELDRFNNWWGPDNPYIGQLPSITDLRIDVVAGQDARILAMRSGAADTERYEVFGAYVNTILNAPELDLITGVASQWDYVLGFNMTIPGLDDLTVRRAISLAMDRQYLVNVGRLGFGTITNSTIPATFFPSYYSPDGAFVEDVDLANEILDDAGYLDIDNDGIREFPGVAPPSGGIDIVLIIGIGAGALVVGVLISYVLLRKK